MIQCRTDLTKQTIKALAKFHTKKDKKNKYIFASGIFLFLFSILNAYGLWMKYCQTNSLLFIIAKSSVFICLSVIILYTGLNGKYIKLYIDLKNYISETNAAYIDYIISDAGIEMLIQNNKTFYQWNCVDSFASDNRFFYFTCSGKHSLIQKSSLSQNDIDRMECLIKEKHIPFVSFP